MQKTMRWRLKPRRMIYIILLVLSLWLVSSNYTIVPKVYHRSVVSSLRQWSDSTVAYRENTDAKVLLTVDVVHQITDIAKSLHRAKIHVRGTKTSDALRRATESMDGVLKALNINKTKLLSRAVQVPKSVCPEKYMGSTFGYPFFYKGFEITDCSHKKPLSDLVTVVVYIKNQTSTIIEKRLRSFGKFSQENGNISIFIAAKLTSPLQKIGTLHKQVQIVTDFVEENDGAIWTSLVYKVKTPYVLIARDVEILTEDVRLERLVREIEMQQVPVAAGAVRQPNGQWSKGCYQTVHKNFTLRYVEGYDESFHECLFCDYSIGPFVTSVNTIKEFPFSVYNGSTLFEDWFLKIKNRNEETIVCPDSMFHIENNIKNESWKQFMRDWKLFKMISPNGEVTILDCGNFPGMARSRALSPCLLQNNADAVNTVMNTCAKSGVICELQEGTSLGAVKLGKVLPWERDADITFLSDDYSKFQNFSDTFTSIGFSFRDLGAQWCCADNRTAGGKFMLSYAGWNIEMYGQHLMDSEILLKSGLEPTKVLLDGNWVAVPRNPGLFVRNRYGREIYQHAAHWMTTGSKTGWMPYKTNVFPKCDIQGNQDCLDRYNADGDLPFTEPLP